MKAIKAIVTALALVTLAAAPTVAAPQFNPVTNQSPASSSFGGGGY
jgi:hypothetical protein